MSSRFTLVAAVATVAFVGTALAERGDERAPEPFAATEAAATGREVPVDVEARFQDRKKARVVGADASGQEYALSRGRGGVCLIAVRAQGRDGFEVCSPNQDRDITTMTAIGEGRIRTVVLQSRAGAAPPTGGQRVAPGLWVHEGPGALPGG